jgi:hypothetical protein
MTIGTEETTKVTPDTMLVLMKEIISLRRDLEDLKKNQGGITGTGRNVRGPRKGVKTLDTKTGKVYHSHAAAGMAVAGEYGLPVNNWVWFEIIKKDPTRFKDISDQEFEAIQKAGEKQETPAETES